MLAPLAARSSTRVVPDEVPSYRRPPPSADDCLSVEQVHALLADFLRPRTLTRPRSQEQQHHQERPQQGTLLTLAAAREAPMQDRDQVLARSQAAARIMNAGLRALNAGAMDEAAYQVLLQAVRTGTAIPPALAGILTRFDTAAEDGG
jgi:hypothetical protein